MKNHSYLRLKNSAIAATSYLGLIITGIICALIYVGCYHGILAARLFLHEQGLWTKQIAESPVTGGLAFYFACFMIALRFYNYPVQLFFRICDATTDAMERRRDAENSREETPLLRQQEA